MDSVKTPLTSEEREAAAKRLNELAAVRLAGCTASAKRSAKASGDYEAELADNIEVAMVAVPLADLQATIALAMARQSVEGGEPVAYYSPEHWSRVKAGGEYCSTIYPQPAGTCRTPLYAAPPPAAAVTVEEIEDEEEGDYDANRLETVATICVAKGLHVEAAMLRDTVKRRFSNTQGGAGAGQDMVEALLWVRNRALCLAQPFPALSADVLREQLKEIGEFARAALTAGSAER